MDYKFYVQPIWFYLKNGSRIEGDLASYHGPFGATITFPFEENGRWRVRLNFPLPVSTPETAFEWLLEHALLYANNHEMNLVKIDNPSSDPFIDKRSQENFLSRRKMDIPVLIRGS